MKRSGRRVLLIVVCTVVVGGALPAAAADPPPPPPDYGVYPISSREICHIPRSGNKQGVLGFDGVSSVKAPNGKMIWFFGDTYVDRNGSGVFEIGAGEFRTGTIATTTDLNPLDCIDLKWKKVGPSVASMVSPRKGTPYYECLTWPNSGIVIDGVTYASVTVKHRTPICKPGEDNEDDGTTWYTQSLVTIDPTTMATQDLGTMWERDQISFGGPILIGGYVYVTGMRIIDHGPWGQAQEVLMARVEKGSYANPTAYRYWNGDTWALTQAEARPLYRDAYSDPGKDIAYNKYLDRYLMVYGCAFTAICARTAVQGGRQAGALTGGWGPAQLLYDCKGDTWSCHHASQHPDYSPDDSKLYITVARHENAHYWTTLREFDIANMPGSPGRDYVDPHADFYAPGRAGADGFPTGVQGREGWTYVSWPSREPLVWESIVRKNAKDEDVVCSRAWVGTEETEWPRPPSELCSGIPHHVPRVYTTGSQPGITQDVARIWTARDPGTVSFSGEAWVERTCGDGVTLEISKVSGTTTTVLSTKKLKPKWVTKRATRINDMAPVTVAAGDQLVFAIDGGAQTGQCDRTYFTPLLTFDQPSLRLTAIDDFTDNPLPGFRGWNYERCPVVTGSPASCVGLAWNASSQAYEEWFFRPPTGIGVKVARMTPPTDPNHAVTRSWTAPAAGRAVVDGRFFDVETGAACGGDDGVLAAAFLDGTKVWPAGPDWSQVTEGSSPRVALDLTVAAGSTLKFLVTGGTNAVCDDTRLNSEIRFTW